MALAAVTCCIRAAVRQMLGMVDEDVVCCCDCDEAELTYMPDAQSHVPGPMRPLVAAHVTR